MNPTRVMIAPGVLLDITVRCGACGDRDGMEAGAINGSLCITCRCTCDSDDCAC